VAEAERGKIVLIGGGTRSGKSALALCFGRQLGQRRAFVATARALDDEMRARIERHQREREGAFDTAEAPRALAATVRSLAAYDVVVVDCVTHWLSNLLLEDLTTDAILHDIDAFIETVAAARHHTVLVTNEVGMSVHPETPLGRTFVDLAGFANQRLARASDEVYFAVMGTFLPVRRSQRPPVLDLIG